jgi:coenzyme F420-reducing hydrogenase alpha subunit
MSVKTKSSRTIHADYLARVEGEGGLYIRIDKDHVSDVKLKIFEPPRFFEAFLRGRLYSEAPDLTARICGICPVAYQVSAVGAVEQALSIRVSDAVRDLRRLLYCGEWIESHALHIYFLHAPDFLGYPDAIAMARDHRDLVMQALHLKKTGNQLVAAIGGREIHPINVKVGGFHRMPRPDELVAVRRQLEIALGEAESTLNFVAQIPAPDFERDYDFVALRDPDRYAIEQGRIVSSSGLDVEAADYERHFVEEHVRHSNALHSILRGHGPYHVGPLARVSHNFEQLPQNVRNLAEKAGFTPPCRNPFRSIVARAVELYYAIQEACRLIDAYNSPDEPAPQIELRKAAGCGVSEAPRGLLYHRYNLDEQGTITDAKIVPPTAQNLKTIEADLHQLVESNLEMQAAELEPLCEQAVRNYDPCISCATHFLKLKVERIWPKCR